MVLELGFISNFKILIVGILMYVIIYYLIKNISIFSNSKDVPTLIAFLSVIIVSFTGVLTYVVSYAITWFSIIIFIIFLIIIIASFLGINVSEIAGIFNSIKKPVLIVLFMFFIIILAKGFFALNNTFDIDNPQNNSYEINTEFNSGIGDMVPEEDKNMDLFSNINIDQDLIGSVIFLIILGVFVMII